MRALMMPGAAAFLRAIYPAGFAGYGFDLFAEAVHIDIHHGIVGFIGRVAKSVGHE